MALRIRYLLLRNWTNKVIARSLASYKEDSVDNKREKGQENETELAKKLNVSRMPAHLRSRMEMKPIHHGEFIGHQPWMRTSRYKKKSLRNYFGKYGKISAVSASCLWPTKAEINEMEELERLRSALPLKAAMDEIAMEKKNAEMELRKREKDVLEKYAQLDSWIAEFQKRKEKKLAEALEQKKKKEKLIEEVRVFLGFQVDVKDERFQEILASKEKEERKAAKEAKKKEKIARELAKLKANIDKEKQMADEERKLADEGKKLAEESSLNKNN